ncbi:hypothetical protein [Bradyrhizobium acaciae]|uniref:hypothetical protein n=1 Tax=Bradyrhizobium acaciae TaxID=2683706 RepID=UPI001E3489D6|nr:hypothetical protein [Bradyrhizobium acaciae]MCC8984784.1 hypothetical protein [Bradyrhizobium acaciae]
MPKLTVNQNETERGPITSVTNVDTGQTQILFIPNALPANVDQPAARLLAGIRLFTGVITNAASTLLPEVVGPHLMKAAPGMLASPYAGFVDAVCETL